MIVRRTREKGSEYVRLNLIRHHDIATPARVPSKIGRSQIISSLKKLDGAGRKIKTYNVLLLLRSCATS